MLCPVIIFMQQKNPCLSMRKTTYTTALHNKVTVMVYKDFIWSTVRTKF